MSSEEPTQPTVPPTEEAKTEEVKAEEPKPEPPKEEPKPEPPKEEPKPSNDTKIFNISLPLIQKFAELKPSDPETNILEYVISNGLPSDLGCESCIALYLYFHQMLIPFCEILSKINTD